MHPIVFRKSHAVLSVLYLLPVLFLLSACASKPLNPWTTDSPPLALVPVADAGVDDQRGRFREIYCEVNDYPREAMVEAVLRFVEEDLKKREMQGK